LAILPTAADADTKKRRVALPWAPGTGSTFLAQCGPTDDSKFVQGYDGTLEVDRAYVLVHSKSTLQIQWRSEDDLKTALKGYDVGNVAGHRWCTGTLIEKNKILTAGHCFAVQKGELDWFTPFTLDADGKPKYAEPAVLATLMQVNFGYLQANGPADVFPILKLHEMRPGDENDELDYAIIEIGPGAQSQFPDVQYHPIAKIRIDDPKKGDAIAIIQHPRGNPMKVHTGSIMDLISHAIVYDNVDTFNASSGSGIRDKNGVVVGVHTHGGCDSSVVVGGQEVTANSGMKNSAIAAVSKTLRDLAKR
jgi:hypothetical protein